MHHTRPIMFCVRFILLMVMVTPFSDIFAKEIIVSPDGAVKSLTQAIQMARNGDRIIVKKGVYRETDILVNKRVQIIGEDFPEIDGENKGQVMLIKADSVVIRGLVIKNAGVSFVDDNAGIKLDSAFYCIIEGNKFIDNFFALYIARSAYCRIIDNEIQGNALSESVSGNGIHLWYCKEITIDGNLVRGQRDGIYFEFVEDGTIINNISEKNLRYGLHFMFSDRCHYENNTLRNNGAGVAVMYTKHVEMVNNRFENNWGGASYGILLKDITDSRIWNNVYYKNTIGIYAENSSRVTVENNEFIENGWAVKIMANCMDNVFTHNNFIGNSFNVATNSRQNFNTFTKNYWSNYKGYDLDRDGFGDVPFHPVSFFSYLVEQNPPSLILLRSLFIQSLDLAESVLPMLTPETLTDDYPLMRRVE